MQEEEEASSPSQESEWDQVGEVSEKEQPQVEMEEEEKLQQ